MKKFFRKGFAAVLCALVLCAMCVPAFAADTDEALNPENDIMLISAEDDIMLISENGETDRFITRGEFCEYAVGVLEALGCELPDVSGDDPFIDTDSEAVLILCSLGVVNGRGDGIFDPDSFIERQEAAKIVTLMAGVMNLPMTLVYHEFEDMDDASEWAWNYLVSVYALGVMKGTEDNLFYPMENLWASEAVEICTLLYDKAA